MSRLRLKPIDSFVLSSAYCYLSMSAIQLLYSRFDLPFSFVLFGPERIPASVRRLGVFVPESGRRFFRDCASFINLQGLALGTASIALLRPCRTFFSTSVRPSLASPIFSVPGKIETHGPLSGERLSRAQPFERIHILGRFRWNRSNIKYSS